MGFVYTRGLGQIMGSVNLTSSDIRVLLVGTSTTADTEEDTEFIGDFTTLNEITSVDNYARKTLSSLAINIDTTNDEAEADAANVTWTSLGGTTDATIQGAVIYLHVTNDADSRPLVYLDNNGSSFNLTTNGSNVELQFSSEGYMKLGAC